MNVENILNGTVLVENYGDMNFMNLQEDWINFLKSS